MTGIVDALVALPPWLVLLVVFALPAAEAGLMVGVFIPGEIAVLIGGVVAHEGELPLWAVILTASSGALIGDQAGYELGRRHGGRLAGRLLGHVVRPGDIDRTYDLLRRRGGLAVALGRWIAVVRALLPGAAGAIGMARLRFTVFNVVGGVLWASAVAVGGYLVGASYRALEHDIGLAADVLLLIVLVGVGGWVLVRRRREAARPDAS
ncbi:DedA family protein [Nocardioides sp. zg-1228]|uniref:DedA family protein n=1 Tax=Nocardioides sp. zg-1228 TaxID=2763008 RepID=UPI00197F8D1D|nr:DedA family protein [Nocardioides sp. zg-1228]QSF59063.1 DedA family protein [Nocardioides sp. zg-1228]